MVETGIESVKDLKKDAQTQYEKYYSYSKNSLSSNPSYIMVKADDYSGYSYTKNSMYIPEG